MKELINKKEWPKNKTHFQFIEHMEQVLKEKNKWVTQRKLAQDIAKQYKGVAVSSAVNYLSTHSKYLTEKEPFEREDKADGTPGRTTKYWKHEGNDVEGLEDHYE